MRKTRNALLGILTMMSGAVLAVPIEAAERYIPGVYVYKAAIVELSLWGLISEGRRAHSAILTSTPYCGSYYAPVDYYNCWPTTFLPTGISTAAEPYGPKRCLQRPCR